jgi:hypothetical protein
MDGFVLPLLSTAAFALTVGGLAWLAGRVRRRGTDGSAPGSSADR